MKVDFIPKVLFLWGWGGRREGSWVHMISLILTLHFPSFSLSNTVSSKTISLLYHRLLTLFFLIYFLPAYYHPLTQPIFCSRFFSILPLLHFILFVPLSPFFFLPPSPLCFSLLRLPLPSISPSLLPQQRPKRQQARWLWHLPVPPRLLLGRLGEGEGWERGGVVRGREGSEIRESKEGVVRKEG